MKSAKRERKSAGDADAAAIILYQKRDSYNVGLGSMAARPDPVADWLGGNAEKTGSLPQAEKAFRADGDGG